MSRPALRPLLVLGAALCACSAAAAPPATPSDDPADYPVDPGLRYTPRLGEPRWVVPSATLPGAVRPQPANNNVDIIFHDGLLFMAWRTNATHFASPAVQLYVVSSADRGASWDFEHEIALGADVREPRFLSYDGRLLLHFFEGGTIPIAFTPKQMWRIERLGPGRWSEREPFGEPGEVPWRIKRRGAAVYMTSYKGERYQGELDEVQVLFRVSDDGRAWRPVDPARPVVYRGGVSEAAFELDATGALWVVTRNEDGDETGFGSHLCRAPAENLAAWDCPARSDPERYDSPWLFRHGEELYLVARRDLGGPFDSGDAEGTRAEQQRAYQLAYWSRPKRTALYRIDRQRRAIEHLLDLPSAGDTAFPSVRRSGPHTFLIANYTSPLAAPDISWRQGQIAPEGTQIYLVELTFEPAR